MMNFTGRFRQIQFNRMRAIKESWIKRNNAIKNAYNEALKIKEEAKILALKAKEEAQESANKKAKELEKQIQSTKDKNSDLSLKLEDKANKLHKHDELAKNDLSNVDKLPKDLLPIKVEKDSLLVPQKNALFLKDLKDNTNIVNIGIFVENGKLYKKDTYGNKWELALTKDIPIIPPMPEIPNVTGCEVLVKEQSSTTTITLNSTNGVEVSFELPIFSDAKYKDYNLHAKDLLNDSNIKVIQAWTTTSSSRRGKRTYYNAKIKPTKGVYKIDYKNNDTAKPIYTLKEFTKDIRIYTTSEDWDKLVQSTGE